MQRGLAARVAAWKRRYRNLPGPARPSGEASNGQPVQVELLIGGSWTDITSYVMTRDGSERIAISRGRRDENSQTEQSTCAFQLNNRDGRFSPRNPSSPYYGLIGRNTQIRVSVPLAGRKNYRFWGEVSAWPQLWDTSGTDVWVNLTAAGILRRLAQGAAPTRSVLYRALADSTFGNVVAYWPCEDPVLPSPPRIASAVSGAPAMFVSGTAQVAAFDQFGTSDPLPIMTSCSFSGTVTEYTSVTAAQVRFLLAVPADGVTDGKIVCSITHGDSNALRTWELVYNTGGTLTLRPLDGDGATLAGGVSAFGDVRGKLLRVSIELQQNGANIDCAVRYLPITAAAATSATGTLNAKTLTRVTALAMCPAQVLGSATRGMADTAVGHVTLQNAVTSITDLGERLDPSGETAGARVQRLCAEENLGFESIGDLAATMPMGSQAKSKPLDLLTECADADGGMLYEALTQLGLGYRTRESLYNQGPTLTLSYPDGQLAEVPAPVDDDQFTRNDVSVTRTGGDTQHTSQDTGPLNTADPPAGVGVYGESVTLNVETDEDAASAAGWRLRLGTVDEARYPQISVNLAHPQFTGSPLLRERVLSVRPGDRITIADPPSWLPPDDITQMALGASETIDHFEHRLTFTCAPASPWNVATANDSVSGRVDTDGSELATAATSGATSLDVVTTSGGEPWTTDCGEAPWDIRVGGERMTVTVVADEVIDTFTRTESSGWGSADSGQAWSTTGGSASEYSVSAGEGHVSLASVNVSRWTTQAALTPYFDIEAAVATDALATGGSHFLALTGRFQDTANNYLARLAFNTDQTLTLTVRKRVGGTETSLGSFTAEGLTHAAGTEFMIRFKGDGSKLRAKVWQEGTTEPGNWQVIVTDGDLTAAGSIGTRSILSSTNTNTLPVTVDWDDVTVRNPQRFTVTRSVNGVVKAQTAGTAVSLDQPAYVAL